MSGYYIVLILISLLMISFTSVNTSTIISSEPLFDDCIKLCLELPSLIDYSICCRDCREKYAPELPLYND